jgi:GNAT superfamily N-acetyltransferase
MSAAAPAVAGLMCRRATRADLPQLLQLLADDDIARRREDFGNQDPVYERAFDSIDGDTNQLLLVGDIAGRVVAMLQVTFIPGLSRRAALRANIEAVRVASDLRSRGIGRWLIAQAIERARERGCRVAQLTSDKRRTEAHRFYARLGFVASHEGFKLELEDRP